MPSGKLFLSSAILARTASEIAIALLPGRWKIGIATAVRLSSIARSARRIVVRAELDPRDIAQVHDGAGVAGLDDDVLEVALIDQAALGIDRELEIGAVGHRRRAQLPGRDLHVLLTDRGDDIARGCA